MVGHGGTRRAEVTRADDRGDRFFGRILLDMAPFGGRLSGAACGLAILGRAEPRRPGRYDAWRSERPRARSKRIGATHIRRRGASHQCPEFRRSS
jgi:hypothetical protein